MGYVVIGDSLYGDPTEGSNKAVAEDLAIRCDFCNQLAPSNLSASYYVCPTCHVVK